MPRRSRRFDEVSAGGVVVRRHEGRWEACLVRVGNAWSLPKGNVDSGETPEQAALREIAEETGLPRETLRVVGPLPSVEYVYRRRDGGTLVFKRVDHFLVEAPDDLPLRPQPEEIDDATWVPLEEASRRVSYRDLRPVLEEAVRRLAEDNGQPADEPGYGSLG